MRQPLFGNKGTAPSIMGMRKTQQTTGKAKSPQTAARSESSLANASTRAKYVHAIPTRQSTEETRSTATMFDMETFEKTVYEPFARATRGYVDTTRSARRGAELAKEDLTNGYINGDTLKDTEAKMKDMRVDAQRRFKADMDAFNAKAKEMVDAAFALRPNEVNGLELTLSLLGDTDEDYMSLAKQHAGSFTALKAIAGAAKRNGATNYGSQLDHALNNYRAVTSEVACEGLGSSASGGVLQSRSDWETAASMKLDKIRGARAELDRVTGAAPVAVNELQAALDSWVFAQ